MDFLYGQLPELVYDPADLTGVSSNGTIDLKIDNNKRIIDASVRGKLYLYDPNTNTRVEYNGSKDTHFELPLIKKDSLKVEVVKVTSGNIDYLKQFESLKDCKVGDFCLKVYSDTNASAPAYIAIPTPEVSGNVQKVSSANIYDSKEQLDQFLSNAPVGSIYPALAENKKEIILYEKLDIGFEIKSTVNVGDIYVVLDTGLMAIANTKTTFKILNGAIKNLEDKLTLLINEKQNILNFAHPYNKELNKVATEETVRLAVEDSKAHSDAIAISLKEDISNLEDKADSNLTTSKNYADALAQSTFAEIQRIESEASSARDALKDAIDEDISLLNENHSTLNNVVTNLGSSISQMEDRVLEVESQSISNSTDISTLKETSSQLDSRVDYNSSELIRLGVRIDEVRDATTIESIRISDITPGDNKLDYIQTFKDGTSIIFQADMAPKGDKGDTGESTQWYVEENDPIDVKNYSPRDCWLNSITGEVFQLKETVTSASGVGASGEVIPAVVKREWEYKLTLKGATGETGNGIQSLVKSSSEENVDIYTITFTNGETTTFQITNGKDGNDGKDVYSLWLEAGNQGSFNDFINSLKGEPGDTGPKGDPIRVYKIYDSIEDMNSDALNVATGDFVIAKNEEDKSGLYVKTETDFNYVTDFSDSLVPNSLIVEDGKIKLAIDSEAIDEGVLLPATGAVNLNSSKNADGTVNIWLVDSNSNKLGKEITVAATGGGGGGNLYIYRISNTLTSTKFNATTAESDIILKFKCEEMDNTGYLSGVTSEVTVSYSTDKNKYVKLATLYAENNEEVPFLIKISDLKEGINYIRLDATAGKATDALKNKLTDYIEYEVTLIDCRVVTKLDPYATYRANITAQYSCIGAGLDKTSHLTISKDGKVYFEESQAYGLSSSSGGSAETYKVDTSNFEHGVYNFDLYYTYIDSNGIERESAHVKYDLMFSRETNYPLLGAYIDKNVVTYGDEMVASYVAYTPNNAGITQEVSRSIYHYVDGEKEYLYQTVDINITNNDPQEWPINFGAVGFPSSGILYIEFATKNGASKTFEVEVKALEGIEDILLHDTLKIAYIAPTGQMNSISNADSLNTDFTDKEGQETTIQVEMLDFNYTSNGFLQDNENVNIVRMSGDARLRIHLPLFEDNYYDLDNKYIQLEEKISSGRTAEFRFKVSNVTNSEATVINFLKEYFNSEAQLEGSGFRVQPKAAFIIDSSMPIAYDLDHNVKYPQKVAVTHFCDNEIIRLSFVVEPHSADNKQSLKIYTNGELTRIIPYSKTTDLEGLAYIELGSNDCVLDLYSAVFYEKALSEAEILTNYLADIPSIPERIKEYQLNNVQNDSGKRTNSDYYWIDDEGNKKDLSKNFDSMLLYNECTKRVPCILTTGPMSSVKGDKTKVGAIYTKPGKDGEVITVFSSSKNCQTNVQGTTSSKLYPRYNYKLTTKNEAGKKVNLYLVKNSSGVVEIMNGEEVASLQKEGANWVGESTLCWKADVMSPDHANTVNATWFESFFEEKYPQQLENANLHSTVWGCRCLLFNRLTENGEISFMGDGCLNNDKSNADTFGLTFEGDEDNSNSYWNGNVVNKTYSYYNDKGELEEMDVVETPEGDMETKCQKWEFLDNGPNICNFYDDLFFKHQIKKEDDGTITTLSSYEIERSLESTFPDQGDLEDFGISPNYNHIQLLYLWVLKRANFWKDKDGTPIPKVGFRDGSYSKLYKGTTYYNEYDYRKSIFINEFELHFNMDYTSAYFVAVTITALIDNYAKNLFLSCYDTQADKVVFTSNAVRAGVNTLHSMIEYAKAHEGDIPENFIDWEMSRFAIWYPTLYDLDSCYGVDNKGYKWVPYYADWDYMKWGGMQDENDKGELLPPAPIMNGNQSYFWRMFYDVFYDEIANKYKKLSTKGVLTLSKWKDLMINKNIDTVPVRITTEDSIFKYAMPWFYGYTKDNYTDYSETDAFLYLIQANKKLQDTDFMTQRFNMYNSEFNADAYQSDYIKILLPSGASGNVSFEMTPVQDMWCGVQFATQGDIQKALVKTKAGESTIISGVKTSEDTITIYGASLLQEIKGLDQLYGTTYTLNNAINLKNLKIGGSGINNNTTSLIVDKCQMLESIDISNCGGLTSIDVSKNGLLKKVVATNSGLNSITLSNGGYLEELYLPPLQNLTIRNQENLKTFEMENNNRLTSLYVEGSMPAIPLAEIMEDSLDTLTGIRLSNVYLDISSWNYDRTKAFIELLTSDALKGTQLDINGIKVTANDAKPETWFPIISGILKVNNSIVDNDLDLLLTRIVQRYPTLYIQQPDNKKLFAACKWFEIASVCAAAKNGTLYDGFNIEYDEEGNEIKTPKLCSIEDWWDISSSSKSVALSTGEIITFKIAGFNSGVDTNWEKIPLTLYTSVAYGPKPYYEVKDPITGYIKENISHSRGFIIDDTYIVDNNTEGTQFPPNISSSYQKSFMYQNTNSSASVRDITIEFTDTTYVSYISTTYGTTWALNNEKKNNYDPKDDFNGMYYLSQASLGGEIGINEVGDFIPAKDRILEWSPNGQTLKFDLSEGDMHIYNKAVGNSSMYKGATEFNAGAKVTICNVPYGEYIYVIVNGIRPGYSKSTLKTYLNNEYFNLLPEAFRNICKDSRVKSSCGGFSSRVDEDILKFYAISYNELGMNSFDPMYANETAPEDFLDYLAIQENRVISNTELEKVAWHTRSGYLLSYRNVAYVNSGGAIYDAYPGNSNYVVGRVNI